MSLKEVKERLRNVSRWLPNARDRYWGARTNIRDARDSIKVLHKQLEEVNKRIPKSQGGVKDDLLKKRQNLHERLDEQQKRKERLEDQLKRRKEVYEHLKKKKKALEKLEREKSKPSPSGGGSSGVSTPSRPWNPYHRPIANWIIPWLDKSWAAGWRGAVNSGYRSPEYSQQLCYNMCGAPSCPGRCAGLSSNHTKHVYPEGAVDVSDYYRFESIQYRIGSPLRNYLGAADPVHFSTSGR